MKKFCFTVDDNIIFLKDLTKGNFKSIFEHPYLNMYKALHDKYNLKVQLNLFYESEDFCLSEMTDKFKDEWTKNADWLKLSFHSRKENPPMPYEESDYNEVFADCDSVHREIIRFAGEKSLSKATTIHFCVVTEKGLNALYDLGVNGLLGLYGTPDNPRTSYQTPKVLDEKIRQGENVLHNGITYAGIDIILNCFDIDDIRSKLTALYDRDFIKVMIHEQYFYPFYQHYQPEYMDKLDSTFAHLTQNGYKSIFFEETI